MRRSAFALAPGSTEDLLRQALPPGIELSGSRQERLRRIWTDSFDWRLAHARLRAFYVREQLDRFRLTVLDARGGEASVILPAAPRLADELPDDPISRAVAEAIGIRCLLPLVSVSTRRSVATLLDDQGKTIGWLAVEKRAATEPEGRKAKELRQRVVFTTVRGFDGEIDAICAHLRDQGILVADDQGELDAALAAIGRATHDYSSKLRFELEPSIPATAALASSFRQLADNLRTNEPGLSARLDVEFLHDYRVAARRTRSLLSHFGHLLPLRTSKRARGFFADLGRRTGAARDLDVLLFELPSYGKRLPPEQRQGLAAMRGRFEQDVVKEYAAFERWLRSKTYERGIERWRDDIRALSAGPGEETIAVVAAQAIQATAAKVFKQAKKIKKTDDDEPVHRLRIRCKKLRYVLEFSRSLTPGGEIAELIAALKGLQDVLGTFQDLVVHSPRLVATAEREPVDADLILATGWLLAELGQRHQRARKTVDGTVERFRREGPPRLERVLEQLASKTA